MRFLIRVRLPIEAGNTTLKDHKFGEKLQQILKEINSEAAYFTQIDGQRGMFIIADLNEASDIAAVSEKFWFWRNADVNLSPVMVKEDLMKAGPEIEKAIKQFGN